MSLAVFENFLRFAEGAVAARNALPPAIDPAEFESAIVSYGVVLLHAHMEQCLRSAVEARCRRCADPEIRTLAFKVAEKDTGRIGIDALKATLGRFGDAYKTAFRDHLNTSGLGDAGNSAWVSIMSQRAAVGHHGQPATCSLADLRLYYDDIRKVLGFFCHALGLVSTEVTAISSLIVFPAAPPATGPAPP